MIQFTSPAITLTVRGATWDGTERVWVSIRQQAGGIEDGIDIEDATVDVSGASPVVTFRLTQEQTSALSLGTALLQVNWVTSDGDRGATDIASVNVSRNLLDEVKAYAEPDEEVSNG